MKKKNFENPFINSWYIGLFSLFQPGLHRPGGGGTKKNSFFKNLHFDKINHHERFRCAHLTFRTLEPLQRQHSTKRTAPFIFSMSILLCISSMWGFYFRHIGFFWLSWFYFIFSGKGSHKSNNNTTYTYTHSGQLRYLRRKSILLYFWMTHDDGLKYEPESLTIYFTKWKTNQDLTSLTIKMRTDWSPIKMEIGYICSKKLHKRRRYKDGCLFWR